MAIPTVRELFIKKFSDPTLGLENADPQDMMNTISWHEVGPHQRKNPAKAVQRLADGSEGAGKGKYQFEAPALKDAFRLLKMTYRDAGSKDDKGEWKYPDWIKEAEGETDARKLTEAQQDELFLANIMMKKGSDTDIISSLRSGNYKNLWLSHHWGGSAGSKGFTDKQLGQIKAREIAFDESAGSFNQFKEKMVEKQRQEMAMVNHVTDDDLLKADEEVVKELEPENEENAAVASVMNEDRRGVIGDYKEKGTPNEYK